MPERTGQSLLRLQGDVFPRAANPRASAAVPAAGARLWGHGSIGGEAPARSRGALDSAPAGLGGLWLP